MKVNEKRKVFKDAIDLLVEEPIAENGIQMVPVDKIVPFHNHPFRMYEGERLEDMVESVKEHGVLNPVIVQKSENGYEMLAGHNRWNASKIVGKKTVPSIVKEGLSEEEAYVYVIETNLMQRSFTDLLPSEKAAVLAERYEKISCQGKRNDILEEIARLEGKAIKTCGHSVHKSKNRDVIGEEYGMTGRNIARYMRLNKTTNQIKKMVDDGLMSLVVAVELSFLNKMEQDVVCDVINESKIRMQLSQAELLRKIKGNIGIEEVKKVLYKNKQEHSILVNQAFEQLRKKYFEDVSINEMIVILEEALKEWFRDK